MLLMFQSNSSPCKAACPVLNHIIRGLFIWHRTSLYRTLSCDGRQRNFHRYPISPLALQFHVLQSVLVFHLWILNLVL